MYKRAISKSGFTLVELLIVVAIIAILASIAVPNYLEAQTRSKVAAANLQMISVAMAIEMYFVDSNHYPADWAELGKPDEPFWDTVLLRCTTPIVYISTLPLDPWTVTSPTYPTGTVKHSRYIRGLTARGDRTYGDESMEFGDPEYRQFFYGDREKYKWALISPGPDLFHEWDRGITGILYEGDVVYYDPTNGTLSQGDLYIYGPGNAQNPAVDQY